MGREKEKEEDCWHIVKKSKREKKAMMRKQRRGEKKNGKDTSKRTQKF